MLTTRIDFAEFLILTTDGSLTIAFFGRRAPGQKPELIGTYTPAAAVDVGTAIIVSGPTQDVRRAGLALADKGRELLRTPVWVGDVHFVPGSGWVGAESSADGRWGILPPGRQGKFWRLFDRTRTGRDGAGYWSRRFDTAGAAKRHAGAVQAAEAGKLTEHLLAE